MAREGIVLTVARGDESWTLQQAQALRGGAAMACGLAPEPGSAPAWRPARWLLLGREVMHAFFDAGAGLMWPPWRPTLQARLAGAADAPPSPTADPGG